MPQQTTDRLTQDVAAKIKGLVEDRDFLGWERTSSAAHVIVKLIGKATDDEQPELHAAGVMLSARYGDDRPRKAVVVREALSVLREERDSTELMALAS